MGRTKITLMLINLIGGTAVLASYALGAVRHAGQTSLLWGGVPETLRPWIGANMPVAAVGYLLITAFLVFRLDLDSARFGRFSSRILVPVYNGILLPSSLWIGLTFAVARNYTLAGWIAVLAVLALVAVSSAGLAFALASLRPRPASLFYHLALAGAIPFVLQTAVLDALVWTSLFLR